MKIITATEVPKPMHNEASGYVIYNMIGKHYDEVGVANNHMVHLHVLPKCGWSRPHYHKVTEETYYIISGQARMIVDGKEITVSAGQAILLMPNEVHKYCNDQDTDLEFLVISSPPASEDDHHYDV
tara:strand:- start:319 stop:696 length:378 start_codon:yes stop_codon:yes gene_type:complete